MIFYLFIFLISIVMARLANMQERQTHFFLYSSLSILPLVLAAAFRDEEIGMDTSMYPQTVYDMVAGGADLVELIGWGVLIEPLYSIICYLTYHILDSSFSAFLFIQHLIIIVFFYIASARLRGRVSFEQSIFMFCFLLFNMSLNIQRQCMALSIVYLGFTYLIEKRTKPFLLCVIIGFFIHKSALFSLFLIPLIYTNSVRYNRYYVLCSVAFLVLYPLVVKYLIIFSGLEKYEQYSADGAFDGAFSYSELILRIFFMLFFIRCISSENKNSDYYNALTIFMCEFFLNLTQLFSAFVGRIALYAYILYIYYLPFYISKEEKGQRFFTLVINAVIVIYWWYVYVVTNAGETCPYKSEIIGIL